MEDFSAEPWSSQWRNDLAPVVLAQFPAVREHFEWLAQRGQARMTGSGGCVFAAFASRDEAQALLDQLPEGMQGFIAQGLARHPLGARDCGTTHATD